MVTVSTYDAKATLSALLQQVESGEEVVITRHGQPVAKIVRYESPAWTPRFGPLPKGLRANCPPGEDTASPFPDGIPWHADDPV